MYELNSTGLGSFAIYCSIKEMSIPLDPTNSDYQAVLDDIIEQGADCFEGDIPQDILDAAEAKQLLTDS